jgi:exodeoxyribonuclease VII large subunit
MNDVLTPAELPRVWPVGLLCRAIGNYLDESFNPITVVGEIAGFSIAASGHCYFTLKDATGQLRCALFRRAAASMGTPPRDGELVEVTGRIGIYEVRGELQMVVDRLQRAGQGSLFERFLKIKDALQSEGLLEQSRKRKLPTHPKGIGLVTSLGSAALHDVAATLQRRVPHIPILLSPASVQGDTAPKELIQALHLLYALANRKESKDGFSIDVILVVRGGGSMDDLWSFNSEELARTIAMSPVPIVCGVGHETDFTIADFVSDVRAPTPTAAAELVSESGANFLQFCSALESKLEQVLTKYLNSQSQRIDLLHSRLAGTATVLSRQHLSLDALFQNLHRSAKAQMEGNSHAWHRLAQRLSVTVDKAFERHRVRLEESSIRLAMSDPSLVLTRGYVLLTGLDGKPVCTASALAPGQRLQAILVDGVVDLEVLAPTGN